MMKKSKTNILAGILLTLLAGCTPATEIRPAVPCAPGDHFEHIVSGGEPRQYKLYVPASYQSETPAALVLGFHGNTGYAEGFEDYTGLSNLADRAGFLAVYPQGAGDPPTWNIWQESNDVQFIRDLLADVESKCSVDPARVYATGISLGGGMANRLACDLADRFAAVAPVAGYYGFSEECSPARPVAVLAFHGTADREVPYNGFPDITNGPPENFYTIGVPIPQWASEWAGRNKCDKQPSVVSQEDPVSAQAWGGCRDGADVVLYTIDGGAHRWPPEADTSQIIWDFFTRHARTSDVEN